MEVTSGPPDTRALHRYLCGGSPRGRCPRRHSSPREGKSGGEVHCTEMCSVHSGGSARPAVFHKEMALSPVPSVTAIRHCTGVMVSLVVPPITSSSGSSWRPFFLGLSIIF